MFWLPLDLERASVNWFRLSLWMLKKICIVNIFFNLKKKLCFSLNPINPPSPIFWILPSLSESFGKHKELVFCHLQHEIVFWWTIQHAITRHWVSICSNMVSIKSLDSWAILDSFKNLVLIVLVLIPLSLNLWHGLNQEFQSWQFQKPSLDSWEILNTFKNLVSTVTIILTVSKPKTRQSRYPKVSILPWSQSRVPISTVS